MRPDQERVRNLLIDTVTLLCKNSVQFDSELHVEGLLGVSVDKKDVFFVHISKEFSNSPSDGATVTESRIDSQEDTVENSSESNDTQQQRHSVRDTPNDRVSVKTEAIDDPEDGDECLIVEEPHIKLEGRVSPAQLIAGQRRPNKRTSHSSNSQYGGDSSLQGAYGESSYGGAQFPGMGEPPVKRHMSDSGGGQHDDDGYQDDGGDGGEGTPWPTLAGPQGFDPSQSFQHDSDNSQLSLDGTQAGCSSWSTPGRGPSDSFATAHELTTPGSAMSYSEFDDTRSKLKRKYVCPVCSKAFPVPAKMEIHMRTHTGDRPFACEYCGQRFSEKGNMQRHVKLKHSVTDLTSHTYTQGPYSRPAQDDGNLKEEDF